MSWLAATAVVATAVGLHGWSLSLPFQLDDYSVVKHAGQDLGSFIQALTNPRDDAGTARHGREPPYFLRPVLWLTLVVDTKVSGTPLKPWVFHATSVALHGLTTLLVLLVLGRMVSPTIAIPATLLFAINPAGVGAVTWISARGDVLGTLFCLIAVRAAMSPANRRSALACSLAIALSILSKYAILPLSAGAASFAAWRLAKGRTPLLALGPIIGLAAPIILRWFAFGTIVPTYLNGTSMSVSDLWTCMPKAVSLAAPTVGMGSLHDPAPFLVVLGVLLAAAALVVSRRRMVLGFILASACAVGVIVPAVAVIGEGHGVGFVPMSRVFYGPTAAMALCIGIAAEAARTRLPQGAVLMLLVGVLGSSLFQLAERISDERAAAKAIHGIIDETRDAIDGAGGTGRCIVVGLPSGVDGRPAIGPFLPAHFAQPFSTEDRSHDVLLVDPSYGTVAAPHTPGPLAMNVEADIRSTRRGKLTLLSSNGSDWNKLIFPSCADAYPLATDPVGMEGSSVLAPFPPVPYACLHGVSIHSSLPLTGNLPVTIRTTARLLASTLFPLHGDGATAGRGYVWFPLAPSDLLSDERVVSVTVPAGSNQGATPWLAAEAHTDAQVIRALRPAHRSQVLLPDPWGQFRVAVDARQAEGRRVKLRGLWAWKGGLIGCHFEWPPERVGPSMDPRDALYVGPALLSPAMIETTLRAALREAPVKLHWCAEIGTLAEEILVRSPWQTVGVR